MPEIGSGQTSSSDDEMERNKGRNPNIMTNLTTNDCALFCTRFRHEIAFFAILASDFVIEGRILP